jgi:FixJ family two-component response regulator
VRLPQRLVFLATIWRTVRAWRRHVVAGARIAIIEDDPSMLRALQRLLLAAGFQSVGYDSAESFLIERDVVDVDCVLCDLSLPGKSGLELFAQLQVQPALPPLILMTAFDRPDLRERAAKCGAAAYLTKPFPGNVLIEIVSHSIAGTDQNRQ